MSLFQDKVAFVTGGGSGLGRALCTELASRGAISVVADINKDAAGSVADSIVAGGCRAYPIEVDVSHAESVRASVDTIAGKYGRLDYMFNNAGIIILGELRDMELEHWHRMIGVNLLGVLYGTTAAYTHMVKQGFGHIVNVASLGGLIPMPTYTAYSATKHAVVGFSNSLRREASGLGIKISVACPGTMDTGLGAAATIIRASREMLESRQKKKEHLKPEAAAKLLLHGVERNQRMIVFPFEARLLWWLHRVQPALLSPLESWFVKTLRASRTES